MLDRAVAYRSRSRTASPPDIHVLLLLAWYRRLRSLSLRPHPRLGTYLRPDGIWYVAGSPTRRWGCALGVEGYRIQSRELNRTCFFGVYFAGAA